MKERWTFNEEYQCWCLKDVVYTPKAVLPEYQRLSIYAPAPYLKEPGKINPEGTVNGFAAKRAPVILNNNSAGYMQMPPVRLDDPHCRAPEYLARGFVYVTCGNRGNGSQDQDGRYVGKIPANLVDLKTVIRFLRHYDKELPGDMEKIISVGTSAGGAMSALLGVTGNNRNYEKDLEEAGAFMDERDDVYAAQIYCPITDLEHADLSYEWMFAADKENEDSPAGPAGVMTPFEEALSGKLKDAYIRYFNSLGLTDPATKEPITLNEDGRSGSAYDYLMEKLAASATGYLTRLQRGELPTEETIEQYLSGKSAWLSWDGTHAEVSDLDTYVLNQRRRMKPCTAFDTLRCVSGENRVYGSPQQKAVHFDTEIAGAIASLKEQFPQEYAQYYPAYEKTAADDLVTRQKYLNNPMNFIGTEEQSDQAAHFRIRVGASDADTAFIISAMLALKLADAGADVDYALVWEQPHCDADYPGEFCSWIESHL